MTIDLKGDYNGLVAFLNKLESTRNYINTISLESKIEKELPKQDNKSSQEVGIFRPTPVDNSVDKSAEKKEKDILHSVINIVVYTKK